MSTNKTVITGQTVAEQFNGMTIAEGGGVTLSAYCQPVESPTGVISLSFKWFVRWGGSTQCARFHTLDGAIGCYNSKRAEKPKPLSVRRTV